MRAFCKIGALALTIGSAAPVQALPIPTMAGASLVPEAATVEARRLAEWAVATDDIGGRPFVIVDKREARVFAFDARGILVASTPALLGLSRGDDNAPGVGRLPLAEISPTQRITPAGRYEAHLGVNLAGHPILWVDYESALSLHPVATANARERRLMRLATPTIADNRISFGCINVPALFFEDVIQPLFGPANGMVYILPETRSLADTFPATR